MTAFHPSVSEGILSDGEKRKLVALHRQALEIAGMITDRIEVAINSLDATRIRFQESRATAIEAGRIYHEALICLAEDDADDFNVALEKSTKLELIEKEYLVTGRVYECALSRLGWELRNSGAA
jgi:hypothetical protein